MREEIGKEPDFVLHKSKRHAIKSVKKIYYQLLYLVYTYFASQRFRLSHISPLTFFAPHLLRHFVCKI